MLKLLVKKQLTEIFRAYLYDAKKNRARSKAATVGYIIFFVLLMAGVIGGMFTALSYALLMALLGLFLGLKMPNLSWTNEVVPIKQSACVALSLFGGWAVAMIPGALYLLTGIGSLNPLLYLSVVTALVLILSAVLFLWVKKTGSRIFASL